MTARDLLASLARLGPERDVSGKETFYVQGAERAWVLTKGVVDVFAVMLEDERPIGPRHYLFSASPGIILFGVDLLRYHKRCALLAVGVPGTRVVSFGIADLVETARRSGTLEALARQIEDFSGKVGALFTARERPPFDEFLAVGEEREVPAGRVLGTERGITWVHVIGGKVRLCGFEDLVVEADGTAVPLAPGLWLETLIASHLEVIDSRALLERDPRLKALGNLQAVYVRWIEDRIAAKRAEERERISRRRERDQAILAKALEDLSSVLVGKGRAVPEHDRPLLAALNRIGAALDLDFHLPSEWELSRYGAAPLEAICRRSRIRHRRVALYGDWYRRDNGPLLVFRDKEHGATPVAAVPLSESQYEYFDPVTGATGILTRDVAATLDPFGVMFYPPLPAKPLHVFQLLRHGSRFVSKDLRRVLGLSLAAGALSLALPWATGLLFSDVIPSSERPLLLQVVLALLIASSVQTLFHFVRTIALTRMRARWGETVQAALWDRIASLPPRFFRRFTVGDLVDRAEVVDHLREELSGAGLTAIIGGLMSLMQFILMFYYSRVLALGALGITALFALVTGGLAVGMLRYEREMQRIAGRLSGFLYQVITGIAKIRVAGAEERAFAEWARRFRRERLLRFRAGSYQNIILTVNAGLPILSTILVFLLVRYAALLPEGAWISVGDFIAFNAAMTVFLNSALSLTDTAVNLLNLVPMFERVEPILVTEPEAREDRPDPGRITGSVEMSHVSFRYHPDGPLVLDDVSWSAAPGEFVALVGPSGGGKSTIIRLLLGFEIPETGNIYFDGRDVSAVDVTALRRQIGVVLQNSRLRPGSIFDNIVGSSNLTLDDAWRVAEQAGLKEDIEAMPMGMHTNISEGGTTFSGGQRQRILIARALIHQPRILIFDEATSALDNTTQKVVSDSLDRLNATRIVIAHRLSTIRNADRIYVIEKGRIVQRGNYEELMTEGGLFTDLARRQLA
ncbi:MAG: NHLP bacteriocin export ABC transporter permease/ATPase subunit [Candidatus Hydrogenedentota bacterium]|nr:MAG: NHLP bacteriocin export ABC transporter permease/ATPase subunit [Candidatus Hydrogenedentota bacterium]